METKKTPTLILYLFLTIILTLSLPLSGFLIPVFIVTSAALMVATALTWNVFFPILASAISGLALYMLFKSPSLAVAVPAFLLVSAIGTFIALKLKASTKMVILSGTVGGFLLLIGLCAVFGSGFIADIVDMLKTQFLHSLDSIVASFPSEISAVDIGQFKSLYEAFFDGLKIIAPSIVLSCIFLLSYFTLMVSRLFAKASPCYANLPAFSEIHALPIFLIVAAVSYFGQLAKTPFIASLMANLFMIMSIFYTVCGFSLVDFFIKRKIKSLAARTGIFIGAVFVLTLISAFFPFVNPVLIAMVIGFADCLFNYRLRIRMMNK